MDVASQQRTRTVLLLDLPGTDRARAGGGGPCRPAAAEHGVGVDRGSFSHCRHGRLHARLSGCQEAAAAAHLLPLSSEIPRGHDVRDGRAGRGRLVSVIGSVHARPHQARSGRLCRGGRRPGDRHRRGACRTGGIGARAGGGGQTRRSRPIERCSLSTACGPGARRAGGSDLPRRGRVVRDSDCTELARSCCERPGDRRHGRRSRDHQPAVEPHHSADEADPPGVVSGACGRAACLHRRARTRLHEHERSGRESAVGDSRREDRHRGTHGTECGASDGPIGLARARGAVCTTCRSSGRPNTKHWFGASKPRPRENATRSSAGPA